VKISDVTVVSPGSDGIELKNFDNANNGFSLNNIFVYQPGARADVDGTSGIEIRGNANLSNIWITGLDKGNDGIRFNRAGSLAEGCFVALCQGGQFSSLTNFTIQAFPTHTGSGVRIRDDYVKVSNGTITGGNYGVYIESGSPGSNFHATITNVVVGSAKVAGFYGDPDGQYAKFVNCVAVGTIGGPGFFVSGYRTHIIGGSSASNSTYGVDVFPGTNEVKIIGSSVYANAIAGVRLGANALNTLIDGNSFSTNGTPITIGVGATPMVRSNVGFETDTSGSATVVSGATTVVVNHGLAVTPEAGDITVTLTNNPTNDFGQAWVSDMGATQFTINVAANPGASGAIFAWHGAALR
jgi:hypothetical protein